MEILLGLLGGLTAGLLCFAAFIWYDKATQEEG